MPFFLRRRRTVSNINRGHFSDDNGNQNNHYRSIYSRAGAGLNTEDRAGGNVEEFGQGHGSPVQHDINAHLAPQPMQTRNEMYSPTQEYGVEGGHPRQYPQPSQSQYGANFQHQMPSQHPMGRCDPPMEYFPQSPQQGAFNCNIPSSPPPEYDWANSSSQMAAHPSGCYQYGCPHHSVPYSPQAGYPPPAGYPAAGQQYMRDTPHPTLPRTGYPPHSYGNYQCGGHHHNVPSSPPTRYPPPTGPPAANHQCMWNTPHYALPRTRCPPPAGPPPSQATSYPAGNNQYMGYHNAPPHPGVSAPHPVVFQPPASPHPSGNNQYAPCKRRPSRSLTTTTSVSPTPSPPPVPVRVPVQSPPRTLLVRQTSVLFVGGALANVLESVPAALPSTPSASEPGTTRTSNTRSRTTGRS